MSPTTMDPKDLEAFVRALPKTDLHLHLDGSLRLRSLIELAREHAVELPSYTEAGLIETVFKPRYRNLPEYLEGFRYTCAVLQTAEALERATYELCADCRAEGVDYVEIRFAPQLHVHGKLTLRDVARAVGRGIARAEKDFRGDDGPGARPPFRAGVIFCALRYFNEFFGEEYRRLSDVHQFSAPEEIFAYASLELARAAGRLRYEEGLPIVGFDLAGQEKGYPASQHRRAYQAAHEAFLGKTVHAGEDYGPESIFQAIGDCHADRIGHGTWLFDASKVGPRVKDPEAYVSRLAQYVADRRITIEVCLTSNQQTVPELADDLRRHPFAEMRKRRLSTTFCTDNRLVSSTTVTREILRAVEAFALHPSEIRDVLIYGFKRSFFPGSYLEKRAYVRRVIDFADAQFDAFFPRARTGLHRRKEEPED
ncbi:MAG TPA: adenosine deaminase family protein [Planctomycetota bacterium]|nr:adenosine deaminase family protein [Planctomycetota bacterium]